MPRPIGAAAAGFRPGAGHVKYKYACVRFQLLALPLSPTGRARRGFPSGIRRKSVAKPPFLSPIIQGQYAILHEYKKVV